MAFAVKMPELGESVTEGTVTEWLKSVGDTVAMDEPLLEVSTDKVDTEVPSPASGVLLEIKAEEDDTVDVGAVIAILGEEGETPEDAAAAGPARGAPSEDTTPDSGDEDAEENTVPEEKATPAASDPAGDGASTDVTLPQLGESVTEGTVTEWLKSVGDTVAMDEPLLEVSTDKVDTEVPSPVSGVLLEILAEEDDTIEIGAVIARIGTPGAQPQSPSTTESPAEDAPSADEDPEPAPPAPRQDAPERESAPAAEPVSVPSEEPAAASKDSYATSYITPLVRKLAAKHGIDIAELKGKGTGVGGRIRKQDVLDAAHARAESPAAPREDAKPTAPRVAGTGVRPTGPQATQVHEVVLDTEEPLGGIFVATSAAAISALQRHPQLLARGAEEGIALSIVTEAQGGVLSPVIHHAERLSTEELARAIEAAEEHARSGRFSPAELSGGAFTMSAIATGALFDTPVVVAPQVAHLGVGAMTRRPVATRDGIGIAPVVPLALSYDPERVTPSAARDFIADIARSLTSPDS